MQNRTDLHILVHPNQTWTFPLDIATKVRKCTKHEIIVYNFFRFLVCSYILSFPSVICVDKGD